MLTNLEYISLTITSLHFVHLRLVGHQWLEYKDLTRSKSSPLRGCTGSSSHMHAPPISFLCITFYLLIGGTHACDRWSGCLLKAFMPVWDLTINYFFLSILCVVRSYLTGIMNAFKRKLLPDQWLMAKFISFYSLYLCWPSSHPWSGT